MITRFLLPFCFNSKPSSLVLSNLSYLATGLQFASVLRIETDSPDFSPVCFRSKEYHAWLKIKRDGWPLCPWHGVHVTSRLMVKNRAGHCTPESLMKFRAKGLVLILSNRFGISWDRLHTNELKKSTHLQYLYIDKS